MPFAGGTRPGSALPMSDPYDTLTLTSMKGTPCLAPTGTPKPLPMPMFGQTMAITLRPSGPMLGGTLRRPPAPGQCQTPVVRLRYPTNRKGQHVQVSQDGGVLAHQAQVRGSVHHAERLAQEVQGAPLRL
jgi:hypothetical protein